MAFELATGDLLFEPKKGKAFDKSDDHLAQMIELLGNIPRKFAAAGKFSKDYFDKRGELKAIKNFKFWGIEEVLADKYGWAKSDAG